MSYTLKDEIVYRSLYAVAALNLDNLYLVGGIALQFYVVFFNSNLPLRPTNDVDFSTIPPLKTSEFNEIYKKVEINVKDGKGKDREGFYIVIGPEEDPFFLHFEKPTNAHWEKIAKYRIKTWENSRIFYISPNLKDDGIEIYAEKAQENSQRLRVARIEEIYAAKIRRQIYVEGKMDYRPPEIEDPYFYLYELEKARQSLSSYFEASIEEGTRKRLIYNSKKDAYDLWVIESLIRLGIDFDYKYAEEVLNN